MRYNFLNVRSCQVDCKFSGQRDSLQANITTNSVIKKKNVTRQAKELPRPLPPLNKQKIYDNLNSKKKQHKWYFKIGICICKFNFFNLNL